MAELILVNVSKAPATVNLPTGRPIIILPGYAVAGDHFARYVQVGTLVPLPSVPVGFMVKGVSEPMRSEGVRTSQDPSHMTDHKSKATSSVQATAPKTTAVAMAENGQSTDMANIAAATGVTLGDGEMLLDGVSRAGWIARVRSISDTTLAQQMKVDQLRSLAKLLGVDSADMLNTKFDIITSIRVKCRG